MQNAQRAWHVITGLCFLIFISSVTFAQTPELNDANLQLRALFSPLSKPSPSKQFLYEMSAHSADSSWFVKNCADTNQTETWLRVYDEMYYAAYDTSLFQKSESIITNANNFYSDTIPIGIMHFSYFGLKPEAMNTNLYFNFDTVNTVLTDKFPRPGFPYTDTNTIFMSAPLINSATFANPVFVLKPQFLFFDSVNSGFYKKGYVIQIDFSDGTGWHSFNPATTSYYQPDYSVHGTTEPIIRVRLVQQSTSNIFGSSQSSILVGGTVAIPPDETMSVQGLNVGVYNGCNTTHSTGKVVIYLEGIDIMDFLPSQNRNVAEIYGEMLQSDKIIELKNQGYKFVVVDWKNSRVDMRFNALYVMNLIQVLKQQCTDDEQFIVMGESMGGLIARYVLTYMESRDYSAHSTAPFFTERSDKQSAVYLTSNPGIFNLPDNWAELDKMHNTRLFISLDAPQRGASVPLSIQKAYQHVLGIFGPYIGNALSLTTNAFNLFLDAKAAKQLLIEHISTESGTGFYKTYTSNANRGTFMTQMQNMGSYPQFAKIMLMSNGALSGASQVNYYTGALRSANDRLLAFELDTYLKILGIKVPLFGGKLDVRTNPNGNGKVLEATAGTYRIRIKLKWFGVRIYAGYNSLLNIQDYANSKPYNTSAGSYNGSVEGIIKANASSHGFNLSNNYWLFNLFSYTNTNDGMGCIRFKAHVGFNGLASANVRYSICSDGPQFGFVPVQSALDFGPAGTLNLQTNIETMPIATKLANLPAAVDVMVGNPDNGLGGLANRQHLGFRNDNIQNLTGTNAPPPNFNTYFSCINFNSAVTRGFLNLEVGDEELYLENNVLPYRAEYKVEYDLHVNERNPHYLYTTTPAGTIVLQGIYSKQDAYSINSTGFASFIFDATNTPPGHLGFYGTTTGSFALTNEPLTNCCVNFISGRRTTPALSILKTPARPANSYLKISPNPNNGGMVTIQFLFKKMSNSTVSIYNPDGHLVFLKQFTIPDIQQEVHASFDLKYLHLPKGIYFVRLHNGVEALTGKLLILQ